jgi:hypothetical protein
VAAKRTSGAARESEAGCSSRAPTRGTGTQAVPLTAAKENAKVNMYEAIKWPEDMTPSRSPIHFTNELIVAASADTIWSLLVDPRAWPSFYPGVEHVELFDGHRLLQLGTRFETNLAWQDLYASVQEFEPMTRIAWGGGPKSSLESKAYHAWIITPTPDGTHLWTEETMQGPLWIVAKLPICSGALIRSFWKMSRRSPRSERDLPRNKPAPLKAGQSTSTRIDGEAL